MLDLIITGYKFSINMSVTYHEYIQYPVDYTYNTTTSYYNLEAGLNQSCFLFSL